MCVGCVDGEGTTLLVAARSEVSIVAKAVLDGSDVMLAICDESCQADTTTGGCEASDAGFRTPSQVEQGKTQDRTQALPRRSVQHPNLLKFETHNQMMTCHFNVCG